MRIRTAVPVVLALAASLQSWLQAQDFLLSRTDGTQTLGRIIGVRGSGDTGELVFASKGVESIVPWTAMLGIQGPSPKVNAAVAVYLVGGDELKGVITGGDTNGDTLTLDTALGSLRVNLDRLRTLVFRERAKARGPERFRIEGDDFDEALFLEAGRGLDVHGGEIDRITERGIYFARLDDEDELARMYRFETLVGLAIKESAGGAPEKPGGWRMTTTAGIRLRVELLGADANRLRVRSEFGEFSLPYSSISALTRLTGSRIYLSDLTPVRVAELGDDGDLDRGPLYSFQRDRTVSGGVFFDQRSPADGFLVVDGRTYGKGLGVHSKCLLTYRVPPKMTRFLAWVAIDDEVKALGIKGDADVVVRSGGAVLWRGKGLRCGQKPKSLGALKVKPGTLLTLEVEFGKGLFPGDRVDWLSAVFLK